MRLRATVAAALLLLYPAVAAAKPMNPATDEEAVAQAVAIVTAEYVARDSDGKSPSFMEGTWARWRVVAVHKGAPPRGVLKVHHSFHDGSPCEEDPSWKFGESMMPARGSRWILFLLHDQYGWRTYRGVAGRWTATDENLAKLTKLLQACSR